MLWRIFKLVIALLLFITILMYVPSRTIKAQKDDRENYQIVLNDFALGERIASGYKVQGGCRFNPMDLTLVKTNEKGGEWIIYSVDDACNLVVDARWFGAIQDAPEAFREMITKEELDGKWYVAQRGEHHQIGMIIDDINLSLNCETHKNTIRTYGYGGVVDKLTELTGWIVACRKGSGGFISGSSNGSCWAATWPPTWDWVIDSCVKYGFELQSWTVAGQQRGDYHCTPPSNFPCNLSNPEGYYHSLYLSQRVYASGTAYCTRSIGGNYVQGPWGYNLQGCY